MAISATFNKLRIIIAAVFAWGLSPVSGYAQQTIVKYLSGTGSDHTVTWDFFCTKGQNSGVWSKIQVPSCWELQGFGHYDYGRGPFEKASDEQGLYKYQFNIDKSWQGKVVQIVFDGSMTDTEVKINGQLAGPTHQGAFYRFSYDISNKLHYGASNLLEVKVSKKSANKSINAAERMTDFWVFGGIFRPVFLQAFPQQHIAHVAIDAQANGKFRALVSLTKQVKGNYITASIRKATDQNVIKTTSVPINSADSVVTVSKQLLNVAKWSPEFPNLYKVQLAIKDKAGKVIHTVTETFGFRTVELRLHDGFYLNGQKVMFKGVDHHSFWPTSGRTTNKQISINDINLIKDMNMNAVRMSHYPPDEHFLAACDSMGLMVLDELTGWQHKYDDTAGHKLVKEMVTRDVNHPSIMMWDNGNEGGFNFNLDNDFGMYDPQHRVVIHPWDRFNGTDTKHYPGYNYVLNSAMYDDKVYFPTEFLHGLYDGGHGAGLDDFWNLMLQHPRSAGGFLWVFADEGVVRVDKKDSIDTDGSNAPDGILGPFHEKEGSYYTIKEIWSPVYISPQYIGKGFNGLLQVSNRYMFTNLSQCKFSWKLASFGDPSGKQVTTKTDAVGKPAPFSLAPGTTGYLNLKLPANWHNSQALYLTATDPHGRELFTWSWPIQTPAAMNSKWIRKTGNAPVSATDGDKTLSVHNGSVVMDFDKKTGYLTKVTKGDKTLSFANGPALAGVEQTLESFKSQAEGANYVINASYTGRGGNMKVQWTFSPGMPAKLFYSYTQAGEADYRGVTFNYPEQQITGMEWLGRGPYHVWKNRLKGLEFGVWDKDYNDTRTGEYLWKYPEFKGNHSEVHWVKIRNKEMPFTIYTESDHVYLQMLKTDNPKGGPNKTTVNWPEGNIGFMDAIQPVGTKSQPANELGPQGQKNVALNKDPATNTLWFDFNTQ